MSGSPVLPTDAYSGYFRGNLHRHAGTGKPFRKSHRIFLIIPNRKRLPISDKPWKPLRQKRQKNKRKQTSFQPRPANSWLREEPRQQDAPAAAPEPAVPKEPLDRYRFHSTSRSYLLKTEQRGQVLWRRKSKILPSLQPCPTQSRPPSPLPESQSAFSEPANATGPDTTEPMPETVPPASEGDQAQPPAAAAGEGSIRSMPKIIPLPLEKTRGCCASRFGTARRRKQLLRRNRCVPAIESTINLNCRRRMVNPYIKRNGFS